MKVKRPERKIILIDNRLYYPEGLRLPSNFSSTSHQMDLWPKTSVVLRPALHWKPLPRTSSPAACKGTHQAPVYIAAHTDTPSAGWQTGDTKWLDLLTYKNAHSRGRRLSSRELGCVKAVVSEKSRFLLPFHPPTPPIWAPGPSSLVLWYYY